MVGVGKAVRRQGGAAVRLERRAEKVNIDVENRSKTLASRALLCICRAVLHAITTRTLRVHTLEMDVACSRIECKVATHTR